MRLNVFQYHVQDREYSRSEVNYLIDNKGSKHLLLANSEFGYSAGTVFETIDIGLAPIKYAASLFTNIIKSSGKMLFGKGGDIVNSYNTNSNNVDSYNTVNNYYNSNHKNIDKEYYTGREVTHFLNKYYNYVPSFDNDFYYDKIVTDFLNHKYEYAIVPLGNQGSFDIAVLDIA